MLPSLFLSHGSPMLPLTEAPARTFLQALGFLQLTLAAGEKISWTGGFGLVD